MDVGKPLRTRTVEPIREPVPREPEPLREKPAPKTQPQKVTSGSERRT